MALDNQSRLLVETVAGFWRDLPSLVATADWDALESSVLVGLRALDAAQPDHAEQAQRELVEVFKAQPAAHRRLMHDLSRALVASSRSLRGVPKRSVPLSGAVQHERYLEVPVFYATDRKPTGKDVPADWFTGARGELSYGILRVSIPDDHRMGKLDKPRLWRLEFRADPGKHVVLLAVEPMEQQVFLAQASSAVAASAPEAIIFVHGYNVDFVDAVRRAAQIAYDLQFQGVPMLYSWPSEGALHRYVVDENNAAWTGPHFVEFLQVALTGLGAQRVHAVAHSMGCRVLTDGLVKLDAASTARLGQVIFAAPDIDAGVFKRLAGTLAGRAIGSTLYASSNDRALQAAQQLARYPRAGQSGDALVVVSGVDTIDATELETGLMGHSYYGDRTSILADLYYIIHSGRPPAQRFGLRARQHASGLRYWVFAPQGA